MTTPLALAAGIIFVVAIAQSYLGERYILIRLFRRQDLPVLFGNDVFTRRTLCMEGRRLRRERIARGLRLHCSGFDG